MTFQDLSLIPPLLKAVEQAGYTSPSPIQEKAIPPVLAQRDLLGCAQTGTGKTAAFALPILQLLNARKPQGRAPIRALVLTPTRELALQIQESFELYGKHLPLRSTVIFGGVGQGPQVAALQRGVDVLVATPGRLNDLIGQGHVKLGQLEIFVLDEADRMLDMGFVQDVKKVIRCIPEKRQTLLFSATMPKEIVQLANSLLYKPAKVFVTPPATTVEKIEQHLYKVDKTNKRRLLAHLLKTDEVASALVFTRTKHGADRVVRELKREGVAALAIHGNKSQNARQSALARFKSGDVKVLVATDIAARGLDINELSHVFNYDLPNIPETYVHRIGRTGRAGHDGIAVSFCSVDELPFLADIEKLIGIGIPEETGHPWPMEQLDKSPKAPARGAPAGRAGAKADSRAKTEGRAKGKPAAPPPPAPARQQAPARGAQGNPPAGKGRAASRGGQGHGTARGKGPRRGGKQPPMPDTYDNRTGGQAIVTKRPVWSSADDAPAASAPQGGCTAPSKGEDDMSRNNRRRRGGKNRKGNPAGQGSSNPLLPGTGKKAPPAVKKNEKGLFDFSEAELAEDNSLRLVSTTSSTETKYASFEDFLKDH